MGYTYLDDSAAAAVTDDSPLASAAMTLLQRNAVQVAAERTQRCGWAARAGYPWRVCSPWPMARPVGLAYVPSGESIDEIEVRIRGQVDWSVDDAGPPAAGTDALRLCVSTWAPDGRGASWSPTEDDWTTVDTASTSETITLTARTEGRTGWLCLLLWTWSYSEDEGLSTVSLASVESWGGIEVSGLGAIATHPPERAIYTETPIGKSVYAQDGPLRMIDDWQSDTVHVLYTTPPYRGADLPAASGPWGTAQRLTYYTMGVLSIEGVSWVSTLASPDVPGEWLYHTDTPAMERAEGGLAGSIDRLARRRVPVWASGPSQHVDDGTTTMGQLLTERDGTGPTSYRTIAATLVADPPPSPAGYQAIVGLLIEAYGSGARDATVTLRLRSRTLTGGSWAQVSQAETEDIDVVRHDQYGALGRWSPAPQMLWGSSTYPTWQTRCGLIDVDAAGIGEWDSSGVTDTQRVTWATVDLPETDIDPSDYPIRVELAIEQTSGSYVDVMVLCWGLRSLELS